MPFKHQEQKNKKQKILSFVTMARIWYYHEHKRVYSNSFNAIQTPREKKKYYLLLQWQEYDIIMLLEPRL